MKPSSFDAEFFIDSNELDEPEMNYSIASRIPPGRVNRHGDTKDVIANRVIMGCCNELIERPLG